MGYWLPPTARLKTRKQGQKLTDICLVSSSLSQGLAWLTTY